MKVPKTALRSQTKKGSASIYVVVFATILFGVITLSFIHIILSEGSQSSNDELSQSAYDAALAGIEDAKMAVAKCTEAQNAGNPDECAEVYTDATSTDDCYKVQKYLYGDAFGNNERLIQETTNGNKNDDANNVTEQAYTCLSVSDKVAEYRATLSAGSRTMIVRLQPTDGTTLDEIDKLRFKWYSSKNGTEYKNLDATTLPNKDNAPIPPVISYTIAKTGGPEIKPDTYMDPTGEQQSTIILRPKRANDHDATTDAIEIARGTIEAAANASSANTVVDVKPYEPGSDWACEIVITGLKGYFDDKDIAFLVIDLPYGEGSVDIEATMEDEDGDAVPFSGAQLKVDSTGRANQLVRRVEARLNPASNAFPIPEYALQIGGDEGDDSLKKNFYATTNCWTETSKCVNNNY